MLRKIVGPTTCCLLLSCGVLAAPRKEHSPPVYYIPSTVGDKLVFEDDFGDQREWVAEVTEARQNGAAKFVTVRVLQGDFTSEPWRHEVSDKGIYRVAVGDAVLESPECILRLPFRKGETWETTRIDQGETVTHKFASADEEEVEVPAGKFRCLRVEAECVFKGVTWKRTLWYAPRVGMVKAVDKDNHSVLTTVLKSFAAGGR